MKILAIWLGVFLAVDAFSSANRLSAATSAIPDTRCRRYVTSGLAPKYPMEARGKDLSGSGSARLTIDTRTGKVQNVTVIESTGHAILDQAAVTAFQQWRFVPNTISSAQVQMVFWRGGPHDPMRPQSLALNAPRPEYPAEARAKSLTGVGLAYLTVDGQGVVMSARMMTSTGHKILDDAALKAFRRWRFKPGTVHRVKIPIRFTMGGFDY